MMMLPVAYIAAGAGEMYCGACAHDQVIVRELRRSGVDVLLVPLYTPLRWDGDELQHDRVFLGGLSAWMRQAAPLLRPVTSVLRPVLDSQFVLAAMSRLAIQTDAKKLGPMTVSVLQGIDGPHAEEMRRLCAHLAHEFRPQVVHLSNTLLSGLARPLHEVMSCAVVANVQGEEHFLAALPEPHRATALTLLRQNLRDVQRLIRPSVAGIEAILSLMDRPMEDFAIVPPAVDVGSAYRLPRPTSPIVIGYLSAIRPEKGLDLLIDAVRRVAGTVDLPIQFRIAGQVLDAAWWKSLNSKLLNMPDNVRCDYVGELDHNAKLAFLHACHIFCLPSRLAECRAMAALEAQACGCAVVGPDSGIFRELLTDGAGILFESENLSALAAALDGLIRDPALVVRLGSAATTRAGGYSAAKSAASLAKIYQQLPLPASNAAKTALNTQNPAFNG
jgi:glycosyltransferase involved in cell wall biosynthesis